MERKGVCVKETNGEAERERQGHKNKQKKRAIRDMNEVTTDQINCGV